MRSLSTCVAAALLLIAGEPAPGGPREKSSIQGTVTDAVSGAPLRKAHVRLIQRQNQDAKPYGAISAADGRFLIDGLDPGVYTLSGECVGYLERRSPAEVRLSPGQKLKDMNLALTPQAVITGRVLDEDGDPVANASVQVAQYSWQKGKHEIRVVENEGVDDRGVFRIARLAPGRYFVSAGIQQYYQGPEENYTRKGKAPLERPQTTWYPSALEVESATPIILQAGQEVQGIDIRLRKAAVYRITGQVAGMKDEGRPRVFARRRPATGSSLDGSVKSDGSFEIDGVPAGAYDIFAAPGRWASAPAGRTAVEVTDRDVEGVALQILPPRPLSGRIRIEGDNPPQFQELKIYLQPTENVGFIGPVTPKQDGSFLFEFVDAASYEVHFLRSGERFYLKSVRLGDNESRNGTLDLTEDRSSAAEIVLSTRGAQVQGTIKTEDPGENGEPAAGHPQVWLIPDTADLVERERRARPGVFDQTGLFRIKNIAPGDYKIYAWQDVPEDAWQNPEFLARLDGKAVKLALKEDDKAEVELKLIPPGETAALLAKLDIE